MPVNTKSEPGCTGETIVASKVTVWNPEEAGSFPEVPQSLTVQNSGFCGLS